MLPLLILLNALYTIAFSASFSCTNYYSEEDTIGHLVNVSCANPDEVLTSCGYIATNTSRINRRGPQISNDQCKTLSEDDSGPVAGATAVARCCTYPVWQIACE